MEVAPGRPPHQFRLLSDGLLGYAWPKWVKAGEKSEFRVHSVEPYQLSLWRYGIGKEFIRSLGWFDEHGPRATMQITPDGDYTRTGVEWNKFGYANPHLHQYVEAPGRSGLYYFHARTAKGAEFAFPWIVAPERPTSRVAVLASNITWNAYNNFGGRSNYINPDRLPPTPTVNARLELKRYTDPESITYDTEDYAPLSFDRPEPINHIDANTEITDPIEGRAACHIAPAEWRLLGWLEREQFDYDYYAETQLHDGTLDLDAYKVLILSTHPEYWSRDDVFPRQVVGPRAGRPAHVPRRQRPELRGRVPRRHHRDLPQRRRASLETRRLREPVCHAGRVGGQPAGGRVHRDGDHDRRALSRAGCLALGLRGDGSRRTATSSAKSSLHMRCPGGASGHETDKISPSSPKNIVRLAKGTNIDEGGAELAYYETPERRRGLLRRLDRMAQRDPR